jgi:hypothetical protein
MTEPGPLARLDAFLAAAGMLEPHLDGVPVAIGWATVELDRALAELADATGVPADRFAIAGDDELLGARCLVAVDVLAGGHALVALEPATEGRLAATLARQGEGPAVLWLTVADLSASSAAARGAARATELTLSSARGGPLGIERLLLGGPTHGPHRLLVGPPGTIRS